MARLSSDLDEIVTKRDGAEGQDGKTWSRSPSKRWYRPRLIRLRFGGANIPATELAPGSF